MVVVDMDYVDLTLTTKGLENYVSMSCYLFLTKLVYLDMLAILFPEMSTL